MNWRSYEEWLYDYTHPTTYDGIMIWYYINAWFGTGEIFYHLVEPANIIRKWYYIRNYALYQVFNPRHKQLMLSRYTPYEYVVQG